MAKRTATSEKSKPPWDTPEDRRRMAGSRRRLEAWIAKERAIRAKLSSPTEVPHRGAILRARILAAKLEYSADMLEHGDGMPDVRAQVDAGIERMWRLYGHQGQHPHQDDADWAALVETLHEAEGLLTRAVVDQSLPRMEGREAKLLLPNELSGKPFVGEFRTPSEAAAAAIGWLRDRFDRPELAAKVDVEKLTETLLAWVDRDKKVGRRGKTKGVDDALIELGVSVGLPPKITVDAMKKKRRRARAPRPIRCPVFRGRLRGTGSPPPMRQRTPPLSEAEREAIVRRALTHGISNVRIPTDPTGDSKRTRGLGPT
jgi:hypothetical protein